MILQIAARESPTYILHEDTNSIARAIELRQGGRKDEFREMLDLTVHVSLFSYL